MKVASAMRKIKTYSTETFRETFMKSDRKLEGMLKSDFGKFFIVRVEDLIKRIKLPVPPIRSTTHTLIYLTSGEAGMTIGSEKFTIHKHECLLVPAGQLYSFSKRDVNKGFLCNFHQDMFLGKVGKVDLLKTFEFLQVWGNHSIKLNKDTSLYAHQLFKRMLADYETNGLKNRALLQSYFMALLCEINQLYKPLFEDKTLQSVSVTNTFKKLLYSHIRTEHRVSEYASLLHVTPNHLNKVVKHVTGRSPAKWIGETLMLEAKVLLYQTDRAISEIASEIGIDDQSYFSRMFKKYEGVTPIQFRERIEKS